MRELKLNNCGDHTLNAAAVSFYGEFARLNEV